MTRNSHSEKEGVIKDGIHELTDGDVDAIRSSRAYFRDNPEGGVSFEDMVAHCGFTMDQVRASEWAPIEEDSLSKHT